MPSKRKEHKEKPKTKEYACDVCGQMYYFKQLTKSQVEARGKEVFVHVEGCDLAFYTQRSTSTTHYTHLGEEIRVRNAASALVVRMV